MTPALVVVALIVAVVLRAQIQQWRQHQRDENEATDRDIEHFRSINRDNGGTE